jgi:hypothetical protein
MMAAVGLPYTNDQRFADRDAALREVLTCTAGLVGLSHRGEADIRRAAMRAIEPILELADHATVARLELEAIEGRMDRHVRGPDGHEGCSLDKPCLRFKVLQIRREKCWRAWAGAYRALLEGKRR